MAAHLDRYLHDQVSSASPERIRLLLIQRALRGIGAAKQSWAQQAWDAAAAELTRAKAIATELATDLAPLGKEVSGKSAAVYLFIRNAIGIAERRHDAQALDEATRVLEIERETWEQVCRRQAELSADVAPAAAP